METQAHMDIARWSGVSAFGSPRPDIAPSMLLIGEPPINSNIVLKTPDSRYLELYNNAGAVAARTIAPLWTPGRDPMIGVYGSSVNSCVWARGAGATVVGFVDAGVYKTFGVSNAGVLSAPTAIALPETRTTGISILGGTLESPSRVVVNSADGTPSGLVLQSPDETPWVIWIDVASALRITDWTSFRFGQIPLVISTASLPGGTNGVAYNQTLASNGGSAVTWSLSTGTLPAGLTLNAATGAITGTPSAAGTSNFTVKATRGTEAPTKALSIVVA